MARKSLVDVLVADGVISLDQSSEIVEGARSKGQSVEEALVAANVSELEILKAKSSFLGIPYQLLQGKKVSFDVLRDIPEESAQHYHVVPLGMEQGVLQVGMLYPEDIEAREALKFISTSLNIPFKIFLISASDFKEVLGQYKGLGGEVTQALGELEQTVAAEAEQIALDARPVDVEKEKIEDVSEEAPVTKIVGVILKHATEGRASDIHIEPGRERLKVRFRLDGVLYTSLFLPITVHENVVSRIKIMTDLQLDEKRKPQDGRFSARIDGKNIDFRVSTLPTYFGEKVVIRILDSTQGVKTLQELGLDGSNLKTVENALKRPYGMILITGPTGSGKSTTLYAMLQILNKEGSNVISLEDPVEYNVEGVNQSQVRPEIGYDFAEGLRHVLRQDPDIIMVGEIRDKETAQLAIHAALTGHLVLSTLHTNTSTGVIPRLIDMGVDPFLIPATLILAIGQRLVRTLCEESRKEIPIEGHVADVIKTDIAEMPTQAQNEVQVPSIIYQALPSATCPKGTRGRLAVFEVLQMTPELEHIILNEPSEATITAEAKRQGMITMRQDGIKKVLSGRVGLEELAEVVYENNVDV
jgi:type IV pilus assembly protein PilB